MTTLFVNLVLDETGSMQQVKDATIEAFNGYLDELERRPENILFSLTKFNSEKVDRIHESVLLKNVERLTPDNYLPGYSTPLHDAVGQSIRWAEKAIEGMSTDDVKVLMVVQTDGLENASKEWTQPSVKALVEEKIAAGWQFAFLGAGIDAWSVGTAMGIPGGSTLGYEHSRSGTVSAAAALASSTADYISSGGQQTKSFFQKKEENTSGQEG